MTGAPADCSRCPALAAHRTQVVNSRGAGSRILFCGQNPGEMEDEQGKCFVGRSGQVLRALIELAGIPMEDSRFGNACRCWSPGNRTPKKDEIAACRGFLEEEIEETRPDLIVALGAVALESLYEKVPLGTVVGQTLEYHGKGDPIPLLATFHPAAIMRTWALAPLVLAHLEKAKRLLDGTQKEEALGNYTTIKSLDELDALTPELLNPPQGFLSIDAETTGLEWKDDEILMVSFSTAPGNGCAIPILGQGIKTLDFWQGLYPQLLAKVGEILSSDTPKALQGGSFDVRFFERSYDQPWIKAATSFGWRVENLRHDTMLSHKALHEEMPKESKPNELPRLLSLYTGMPDYWAEGRKASKNKTQVWKLDNEILWEDGAADADGVSRLVPGFRRELEEEGMGWVMDNITIPMVRACQNMTVRGILIDRPYFDRLCTYYDGKIRECEKELFDIAGDFNPDSPQQVQEVMFKKLGLPKVGRKTDASRECPACLANEECGKHDSTDKDALNELYERTKHPFLEVFIRWRSLSKTKGTYLDGSAKSQAKGGIGGFARHIMPDDRLHPEAKVGGTECVAGDTLISTQDRGLLRADELVGTGTTGFKECRTAVATVKPGPNAFGATSHVYGGGERQTLIATFDYGIQLRATPEHPVLVRTGDPRKEEWIPLSALKPGQLVRTRIGHNTRGRRKLDPDLSRFLGYFVAEGFAYWSSGTWRVKISTIDPGIIEDLIEIGERFFGSTGRFQKKQNLVEFSSVKMGRYLEKELGREHLSGARNKTIPRIVRQAQRASVLEFIRGYCTDAFIGTIKGRENRRHVVVTWSSVSEELLRSLQIVLWHLGYSSVFKKADMGTEDGTGWTLTLRGVKALEFLAEAPPVVRVHKQRIAREDFDVPWRGKRFNMVVRKSVAGKATGSNTYLRVRSVEPGRVEKVYDLTVPSTHSYYGNAIACHNTGRLSMSNPAAQTPPKEVVIEEWGEEEAFRRAFVAPEGYVMMEADDSQLEVWASAYLSNDTDFLEVLHSGVDIHTYVARRIPWAGHEFPLEPDLNDSEWREKYDDLRRRAKSFVFGVQFGLTVAGVMERQNCDEAEGRRLLDLYFELRPALKDHIDQIGQTVLRGDPLKTPFGRRFNFPQIPILQAAQQGAGKGMWRMCQNEIDSVLREAVNRLPQSSGSDLFSLQHLWTEHTPILEGRLRPNLTVHDSVLGEAFAPDQEFIIETAWKIKEHWQKIATDTVLPSGELLGWEVPTEVKWGPNWGNLDLGKLTPKGDLILEEANPE